MNIFAKLWRQAQPTVEFHAYLLTDKT